MNDVFIPNSADAVNSNLPFDANFDMEALPPDLSEESEPEQEIKPKKLKLKDLHQQTVETMLGYPSPWVPFHVKFHKIMDQHGVCQYLMESENKTVRHVQTPLIEQEIRRFWADILPEHGVFLPTLAAEDATKTRRLWEQCCKPLEETPLPIAWKNQPGLAYERLDFDSQLPDGFDPDLDIPFSSELLSRIEDETAVAAWIGSLFDPMSQRQQYVWIYGKGGEGKGSLSRMLCRVLKSAAASEHPPGPNDRFWTSGLLGKRLVIFPDTNNATFITSGLFKSLTGEDPVRIERKGKDVFTADLNCKYLFLSNSKPQISPDSSDMRRIIYSPIRPITEHKDNYEETLEKETPLFIAHCWKVYKDLIEGNPRKQLPTSAKWAMDAAEDASEYYQAIFSRYYCFSASEKDFVTTADITERLGNTKGFSKHEDQKFKTWLAKQDGVQKVRRRDATNFITAYHGICAKGEPMR